MTYAVVQTTVSSQKNANKIISALLAEKLIACAQITKIESHYIWDDKLKNEPELTITLKTKKEDFNDIEKIILNNHDYDVPEIILFGIQKGNKAYLNWISKVTRQ